MSRDELLPPGARRVTVPVTGGVSDSVVAWLGGDRTPVLAVHGLASNARLWDGVAAELVRTGHPVVAVDQRGHGRSDKPDEGYDFETLCADLVAVIEHFGWRAPFTAGQSWGGNVVLELAARHPGAVCGLALVDGGTIELSGRFADWPTCEAALAPPPIAGTPVADFEAMIRRFHADWPESGVQGTLANMEIREDGTVAPWLTRERHMKILRGLWEHRPSERYPLVDVPVLILSADDPSSPRWVESKRRDVEAAAASLAHPTVRWMEGDHDLHAQFPAEVAGMFEEMMGR